MLKTLKMFPVLVRKSFLRLKHTSTFKSVTNHFVIILLELVIFLITISNFKNWFVFGLILAFLLTFLIITRIKNKKFFLTSLVIIIIALLSFGIRTYLSKDVEVGPIEGIAKIKTVKKNNKSSSYKYTVKFANRLYIVREKRKYMVGDYVYIKGEIKNFDEEHIPGEFNEKEYYKHKLVLGLIKVDEIRFYKKGFAIGKIQYFLEEYLEKKVSSTSSSIIKALVLGISDMSDELKSSIQKIGISHLFVISGLHASLIMMALNKILDIKIKSKPIFKRSKNIIIITFMLGYLVVTNFLISLIRVILNYVLTLINHKYQMKLTSLDIISLNTIIVLLFNPYLIYNLSFVLSYTLALTLTISGIIILNNTSSKPKNKFLDSIRSSFFTTFLCTLFSLPIVVNINSEINILSLVANVIYIPFVSYILLPCSFLTFLIPFIDFLFKYLVEVFVIITSEISKIDALTIILGKPNILLSLVYYVLLIVVMGIIEMIKVRRYSKRLIFKTLIVSILLFFVIGIWVIKPSIDSHHQVVFFDLPVGESTLIVGPYRRYHILIDTGEVSNRHEVLNYLLSQGIRKLDYCFITHSDSDHIGELESINEKIKINNLVIGQYDYFNANLSNVNRLIKTKSGDKYHIRNLKIEVMSPIINMHDTNNNSLVLMFYFKKEKWLFLGDIEKKAEKVLVDKYQNISCDLVKIAHHGSATSTSYEFLKSVSFQKAVIMSGYRNQFGFPNQITLKKIEKKKLYLTKEKRSVILKVL